MATYDRTSSNTLFRHADGRAFDPLTDYLTPTDLFVSQRGPMRIHDALACGHLLPVDLERAPCSFNAGVLWGALLTADIPTRDFSDIRLGERPWRNGEDGVVVR